MNIEVIKYELFIMNIQNKRIILITCIIFSILAIMNPNKKNFDQYVSNEIKSITIESGEDLSTANILSGLSYLVLQSQTNIINRQNYIIFSTYTLDTAILRSFGTDVENIVVLGILGNFIPLSGFNN